MEVGLINPNFPGVGGWRNHHLLSENCDFSGTKPPLDLKPVCKLEFVRLGPIENPRVLYLYWFNLGGPTKIENTFFQIAKLRFLTIFDKITEFSKNSQGLSLKPRGLLFWILALYIHIEAPVKTEFAKSIIWSIFVGLTAHT